MKIEISLMTKLVPLPAEQEAVWQAEMETLAELIVGEASTVDAKGEHGTVDEASYAAA